MTREELVQKITELKKEKNAIVLAHYYSNPDVQDVADFLGDSLELSRKAGTADADIIVFAGVHFMAETAALISPNKKVLVPALGAGCTLADGVCGENLAQWKAANPDGIVVSYVNTTAEVKSHTDICCTSANALSIVKGLPSDAKVFFVPDKNLSVSVVNDASCRIYRCIYLGVVFSAFLVCVVNDLDAEELGNQDACHGTEAYEKLVLSVEFHFPPSYFLSSGARMLVTMMASTKLQANDIPPLARQNHAGRVPAPSSMM